MEKLPHNCEAYNTFGSIGSDYHIVCAKVKISLPKNQAPNLKENYDWSALKRKDLQQQCSIEINNKYQSLC